MQYRARIAALVLLACAACQRSGGAADWKATPLGRDMDRICNAVVQSGAIEQPESARQLLVAQWLGGNLESQQGRDFLAELAGVEDQAKAAALEAKARAVGIARCPIADEWRKI